MAWGFLMTQKYLMEIVLAEDIPFFLVSCDVDAHDGQGAVVISNSPPLAMQFDDIVHVMTYRDRVSTVRPLRDDGKPNRPLSYFTIGFIPVDVADLVK